MKKVLSFILALVMLTLCVVSCTPSEDPDVPSPGTTVGSTPDTTEPDVPDDTTTVNDETTEKIEDVTTAPDNDENSPDKTYRILLIGNSFTHYNNMNKPQGIFYNVAVAAGYKNVIVDTVTKGGWYLSQMADEKDEMGSQVRAKLNTVKYDHVVIQEQSGNPISDIGDFYDSVRDMKKLVDANGAKMWLYETWGYRANYSSLVNYGTAKDGLTATADMEMKLRAAYRAIGAELGVEVIPAGVAMLDVYENNGSKAEVYHTDYKHPSAIGSTLIAFTIFEKIFGVDSRKINGNIGLSESVADILKEAAHKAIADGCPVKEGYELKSEGINRENSGKVRKVEDVVDSSKTVMLTGAQNYDKIISVILRDDKTTGDGWMTYKRDTTKTFSGIRGDKNAVASAEYSDTKLTDAQKADIADIGYGVSIIGIDHMDASKKGTINTTNAGTMTSVGNLINGHWGSSYMAAMFFDLDNYNVNGEAGPRGAMYPYTALITLNFGKVMNFEAIGYFSGSLEGFAQAQDVYVSDDGVNWTKVESACYDVDGTKLESYSNATSVTDPWNNNKPSVGVAFSMSNTSGKYIRIGIIDGGKVSSNVTTAMEMNTREIVVFGSEK